MAVVERPRRGPWVQVLTPAGFERNRARLPVPNLPPPLAGLRLLHLTDLHLRPRWQRPLDELLEHVAANPPDLIVISGDLIEHRYDPDPSLPVLERCLRGLRSRLGTFVILGNHDGDLLGPHVTRFGAVLMNRRYCELRDPRSDARLELIGLPGVHRKDVLEDDFSKPPPRGAIPPRPRGALRIVISHFPDTIRELANLDADVFLSGHTHGGQVCLPGGYPIIRHDSLPRRFTSGAHRIGNTWLVVGRGFGFATYQVRLFCPGEIVEVVFEPFVPIVDR